MESTLYKIILNVFQVLMEDDNKLSKTQLVIRRLAAAIMMVGIFVAGVLIRIYVPLPEPGEGFLIPANTTIPTPVTASL